jgi:hypothetical protein
MAGVCRNVQGETKLWYVAHLIINRTVHVTTPLPTMNSLRMVMVAMLLTCGNLWIADRGYPGDTANGPPKGSSSQAEQSPEEAAGGKQNLQRMKKACDEDVKKLCPDIRPGGGRILQCLHGHESSLTPACRQVLGPRSSNP